MSVSPARVLSFLAGAVIVALGPLGVAAARADAILVNGDSRLFPIAIDVDVEVRAQVESTTYRFEFASVTRGSHVLTVPSPPGGSPIGVDVDRGDGFVPLPIEPESPPSLIGGGPGDTALVAWHGTAPLVAELRDLEPGPLTVRVRFVRLVRRVAGDVTFEVGARRCPARPADDPGARVQLHARIATARNLERFEAFGGTGTAIRRDARAATVETAPTQLRADEVVRLRYREVSTGIHAQLVTHRLPDADPMGGAAGYFLLLVDADQAGTGTARTVSLVIDRSASMEGDKLVQAQAAAHGVVEDSDEDDRFALYAFDEGVDSFSTDPVPPTPDNVRGAHAWIDALSADGLSNLDGGLQAALGSRPAPGSVDTLIVISDEDCPSTPDQTTFANVRARAGETRIFTVSVGANYHYPLMEALARRHRGRHLALNDAQARFELADRVRELVEELGDVRLSDVELAVAGIGAEQVLPESPSDLFAGGQIVLVGRYQQPGAADVRITGQEGARPFSQVLRFDAPGEIATDDIIRYVWATEKVGALMADGLDRADPSTVHEQVRAIGMAYRIQTPYTRYGGAVDDPEVITNGGGCSAAGAGASWWLALAFGLLIRRGKVVLRP